MQINISKTPQLHPTNIYNVEVKCYFGDADGDGYVKLNVSQDNIRQIMAEIIIVDKQFHGRGGCRKMYDQTNYFVLPWSPMSERDNTPDNHFEWLSIENNFPYDGEGAQQNYTIDNYKVWWFDEAGTKFKVDVTDFQDLLVDIKVMNQHHKIDNSSVWGDDLDDLDEKFAAYRLDAVSLVAKHSV